MIILTICFFESIVKGKLVSFEEPADDDFSNITPKESKAMHVSLD